MTIKDLHDAVIAEATALKAKATSQEIVRLNINRLRPDDYKSCIYGQMTGDCFSKRANELIDSCAPVKLTGEIGWEITPIRNRKAYKRKKRIDHQSDMQLYHYSPIEVFILEEDNKNNGNNEQLIDFLQGNISELNFK